MRTPEQVLEIVHCLEQAYPLAECTLDYQKDYELLFSVRLAAQCTDERVNQITPALLQTPMLRKWSNMSIPADFTVQKRGTSLPAPKFFWKNMTGKFPAPWKN